MGTLLCFSLEVSSDEHRCAYSQYSVTTTSLLAVCLPVKFHSLKICQIFVTAQILTKMTNVLDDENLVLYGTY